MDRPRVADLITFVNSTNTNVMIWFSKYGMQEYIEPYSVLHLVRTRDPVDFVVSAIDMYNEYSQDEHLYKPCNKVTITRDPNGFYRSTMC